MAAEGAKDIAGRYHVIDGPIGGGMADVFKAYDLRNEHGEVAVKVLRPTATGDSGSLSFKAERRALERLSHPTIVPLLDSGEDEGSGRPFLVFPWIEGRLQEELLARGAMAWEDWWQTFGHPILQALEIAHRNDVQHRDLKPANVLIGEDGAPRVIDFGIAKIYSRIAPDATLDAASAPFTPREPVSESPGMTRDTHAWAALTVFAVAGHDAYGAGPEDPYERLAGALAAARASLPSGVAEIVGRALSEEPDRRPENAMVLAADLDASLETERRREARREAQGAPAVPVVVRQGLFDALEADLEMFSAEVRDLVERELEGEIHVTRSGHDDRFRLTCGSLSVAVKVHEDGHALIATQLEPANSDTLDRDRERGFGCPLRFRVGEPAERDDGAEAVRELQQQLSAHRQQRKVAQKDKRARPIVLWRGLLSLLREFEASEENPLRYRATRVASNGVGLRLEQPPATSILGDRRVAPGEGGPDFSGEVSGVNGPWVTIRPDARSAPMPLSSGTLRRDRRSQMGAIERQQRALDTVEYGRSVRADLAEMLVDPTHVRPPNPVTEPVFARALDESKRAAVKAALGSQDLLLVRGPPGTGKTTFITELVVQELLRAPGARILVASQSNAALDHALAGIHELRPGLTLLRVAPPDGEKVARSSEPLLLRAHLERWKSEAVERGTEALQAWAREQGLDLKEIETASLLAALAGGLRELVELEDGRTAAEAGLAELRGSSASAAQSATTSQLTRERQAEIEELREAQEVCANRNREALGALMDLGALPRRTRPGSLSPQDLEEKAEALLPGEAELAAEARTRLRLLAEWHARFGLGSAFAAAALARASVVAATCVGLGGLRGVESVEFDLVIVDEASKATAPELLIPLSRARRIVLVGDDRQLPPYVEEGALDEQRLADRGLAAEELRAPLFTQLAEQLPPESALALTHQHRMHPVIGGLISSCFYDDELTSEARQRRGWLGAIAPRAVTWLTTSAGSARAERQIGATSFANDLEIRVIAKLLQAADAKAHAAGVTATVAVLSGYAGQRDALEQRIARERPRLKALSIECGTVDAFQGREAEIVIFSLTRSNPARKLGFVRERPRLNVALSRARDTLIVVGDHVFARDARGAGEMRRVIEYIEARPQQCAIKRARW